MKSWIYGLLLVAVFALIAAPAQAHHGRGGVALLPRNRAPHVHFHHGGAAFFPGFYAAPVAGFAPVYSAPAYAPACVGAAPAAYAPAYAPAAGGCGAFFPGARARGY